MLSAPCSLRHALRPMLSAFLVPVSEVKNMFSVLCLLFSVFCSHNPQSEIENPHSNHSWVCSLRNTTGFLRRIAIEGSNPTVMTMTMVVRTSKMLSHKNGL